ncbi:NAD(P)H-flavin reductase [Crossiella equi]|uniref:NAD(P)H-flavin reductase n=1 Tax=Crossiella equi TaxID=130796 RepID=A0ABS5A652_9PSEU|nr:FAD/NAD(P)-binding protein [Crossiella equi]MBP2472073.1 NAD(P)H-flavin reductase [Crossiella equi]
MTVTEQTGPAEAAPWHPVPYRVTARHRETADTTTLVLRPVHRPVAGFRPGQFTMLYAFGVGEVPVSISGDPILSGHALVQTVREVGAVSRALARAAPGTRVGVRGPYGRPWDLDGHVGDDLLLVGGGIGLAPLRPALRLALARRRRYRRLVLLVGARSAADLPFRAELDRLLTRADVEVVVTVDRGGPGWDGRVGLVTAPLAELPLDPARTTALLCGPEPMMRACAEALRRRGVRPGSIQLSLERNMKCGTGLCGHCQLGPLLLCRDGPVVPWARAEPLLSVREL